MQMLIWIYFAKKIFKSYFIILAPSPTQCEEDRKIASEPTSFDMFNPECAPDGSYKAVQCYKNTKFGRWCWCVDAYGQEIIGTKVAQDTGNLTDDKCKEARKGHSNEEYWTAFYRHPTTTPVPMVTTTMPPMIVNMSTTRRK